MRVINPYEGVNFSTVPKINSISHEHINTQEQLKKCYDRGIRHFASVWYQPAQPHYLYSGWSGTYLTYANTSEDDFSTTYETRTGSIASFEDKDGNTIDVATLPQIPNAEHPKFAVDKNASPIQILQHFNVLGNLWAEVGHGIGAEMMAKIQAHPLWDLSDINTQFTSDLLYQGKVFGTINHNKSLDQALMMLNTCPTIFKATEINNNGYNLTDNQAFRSLYDQLLTMGYRIWGTSVQDWQGDYRFSEVQYDRGCNVLLIDGWDNMTVAEKSEAGLDSYIDGKYYASAFGNYSITGLSVNGRDVNISFSQTPSRLYAITNKGRVQGSGASYNFRIPYGAIYLRFEAYFDSDPNALDFIFTNPMFFEDNEDNIVTKSYILGII